MIESTFTFLPFLLFLHAFCHLFIVIQYIVSGYRAIFGEDHIFTSNLVQFASFSKRKTEIISKIDYDWIAWLKVVFKYIKQRWFWKTWFIYCNFFMTSRFILFVWFKKNLGNFCWSLEWMKYPGNKCVIKDFCCVSNLRSNHLNGVKFDLIQIISIPIVIDLEFMCFAQFSAFWVKFGQLILF